MKKFTLKIAALVLGTVLVPQLSFANPVVPMQAPVQTESFRVLLDAGHGGRDEGAPFEGAEAGKTILEKDATLTLALAVKSELEAHNVQVVLTRTEDKFISLQDRVKIAQESMPDCLVSLHLWQKMSSRSLPYQASFYQPSSQNLAKILSNGIRRIVPLSEGEFGRSVKQERFYVLRKVEVPAAFLSVGVEQVREPQAQQKLVHEIANSILYFAKTTAKK